MIKRRLHISGLTPAISSHDLENRLGSFGSVLALDGFGKLDVLGQPRKFAHVTLETTKQQLTRCMNALSGSTWKGAKLRIGEAKPDFRERIALENASQGQKEETHPRKRRKLAARGVQGKHSHDMSLVTPLNVHQRPQWRVTPLGRLIRPMRIRPSRPLDPPPFDALKAQKRLRTIDPIKWGSTHLAGVFLEGERVAVLRMRERHGVSGESTDARADEEVEELLVPSQSPTNDDDSETLLPVDLPPSLSENLLQQRRATSPRSPGDPFEDAVSNDLAEETAKALQLLHSMFGEANEDWGGAESVDSDMEQTAAAATHASETPLDSMDFEIVPAAQPKRQVPTTASPKSPEAVPPPSTNSKIYSHLERWSKVTSAPITASDPTTTTTSGLALLQPSSAVGLDATLPFFFLHERGKATAVGFTRTESEEQIRMRWEGARGELTREWKRRHREAVKSRRRRHGHGTTTRFE
ncbi:hypothetical protein BGW80DRAFT_1325148 [Lactifluus volemus]|nr:hypothetical protein BGW80DRAFT_1325148 [Lactifluus volemus]